MSPKCGSTSLQRALKADNYEKASMEDAPKGRNTKLIVRNPHERLVSNWAFFTKKYHRTGPTPELCVDPNISLEDYFEFTKENPNKHWQAQTLLHPHWRYYTLIDLKLLNSYSQDPRTALQNVGTERTSDHDHWLTYYSEDLYSKVAIHYIQDMEMYLKARRWRGRVFPRKLNVDLQERLLYNHSILIGAQ